MRKQKAVKVAGEAPAPVSNLVELPEELRERYQVKHLTTPFLETYLFGRIDVRRLTAQQAEALVQRGSAYIVAKASHK